MIITLKLLLIISLLSITCQDLKERKVSLFLFVLVGLLLSCFHYNENSLEVFLISIAINIFAILIILSILFLYSKVKLKKSLNETFGIGDAIFFSALAIGFPTATFLVLFSFSLFFSFALFLILKKRLNEPTVPLAGFQALFLSIIFLVHWTLQFIDLYAI